MSNYSVATLAELKAAVLAASGDGQNNTITLTANIGATSSADFVNGTGGSDLLKIAVTDGMTLSIVGGGHSLDANYFGRVLEVSSGTVSISDLTIREGALAGDGGGANNSNEFRIGGGALGAGIYNSGNLTLANVSVTQNAASGGGGGYGGGYGGGGGGGGGPGSVAGRGGDGAYGPGSDASGGTGGAGGAGATGSISGQGGSSQGGAGGVYGSGSAGAGGTASIGGLSVGGGGGGGGGGNSVDGGIGGAAVGGVYNAAAGILRVSGGAITGNIAAGGGGGVNSRVDLDGPGGIAVGGVMSTGLLTLDNVTLTGNDAAGGVSGALDRSTISYDDSHNTGVLNNAPTGSVSVSGTAIQGQVLTASNTLADIDGLGTITYQWKADGAPIGGATTATYVLTSAEIGKLITVTASYADGAHTAESVTSAASAAVASPPAPPSDPPPPPVVVSTVDGAAVSTTNTTAPDGSQAHTVVVAPLASGQLDADIPLVVVNGANLVTVGLPTGTGFSASGPTAPTPAGDASASLAAAINASAFGQQMGGGASAFLQAHSTASVLVQTLTLTGAQPGTPLAITGLTPGTGPMTALIIDTHNLAGQTLITLNNIDFAAVIGEAHVTGGAGAQTVYADDARQYMVLGADDDALHGGGGNDTVGSAAGSDSIFGDDGNDDVFGGVGNDVVYGGADNDLVQGNAGDDIVQGNGGADLVYGGQGNDLVYGGQGDDQAWGDLHNDQVYGDLGNDTLHGGAGDDLVQGNAGSDLVQGDAGNDLVYGGQGNDILLGGDGNDLLSGDLGTDTLTGGAGADTFIFARGHGGDRITDFRQAEGDHIQLSGPHGAYTTVQAGADTVVDFGGGDMIVLANVQVSSLAAGWIVG